MGQLSAQEMKQRMLEILQQQMERPSLRPLDRNEQEAERAHTAKLTRTKGKVKTGLFDEIEQ